MLLVVVPRAFNWKQRAAGRASTAEPLAPGVMKCTGRRVIVYSVLFSLVSVTVYHISQPVSSNKSRGTSDRLPSKGTEAQLLLFLDKKLKEDDVAGLSIRPEQFSPYACCVII